MSFGDKIKRFLASRRRHKLWQRIVGGLGIIVVFITTYMLILPAITMEKPTYCGLEEHSHTQECYLACTESESAPPEYSCGDLQNYIHVHNEDCYYNGELVCPLEEIENHVHTEECYTEEQVLVCGQEESEGHTHDESCYDIRDELVCGMDEGEDHTHDESCYEHIEELVCGQEESEGHVHDESCYATVRTYNCTAAAHIHDTDCYDADGNLICNLEEAEEHVHSDACMTKHENKNHKHTDECYGDTPNCGMVEHKHTDECYEKPGTGGNGGGSSSSDKTEETTDNHKDENNDHMGYDDEIIDDEIISGAAAGPQLDGLAADPKMGEEELSGAPEDFDDANVEIHLPDGNNKDEDGQQAYLTENFDPENNLGGKYKGYTLHADIIGVKDMEISGAKDIDNDTIAIIKEAIQKVTPYDLRDDFYNYKGMLMGEIYFVNGSGDKLPLPPGSKVVLKLNVEGFAGERYLQVIAMKKAESEVIPSNIDTLTGNVDPEWYDMIKRFYFITPEDIEAEDPYCFVSTKVFGGYVNSFSYAAKNGVVDGKGSFDGNSPTLDTDGNISATDPNRGNDANDSNLIVRSFDSVTYNLTANLQIRGLSSPSEDAMENLKVEFTLDKDVSSAMFNTNEMTWLKDNWVINYYGEKDAEGKDTLIMYQDKDGKHKADGTPTTLNEIINSSSNEGQTPYSSGIIKQVLTGELPIDTLPVTKEIIVGVNVLAGTNNEKIAPTFKVYFENNPLNLDNEVKEGAASNMVDAMKRPEPNTGNIIDTTVQGLEKDKNSVVTITAKPRYNYHIKNNENLNHQDTFDLEKGNSINNVVGGASGNTVHGRMFGYGVTLTLFNEIGGTTSTTLKQKGIMGIELPVGKVKFDFNVEAATGNSFSGLKAIAAQLMRPALPVPALIASPGSEITFDSEGNITESDSFTFEDVLTGNIAAITPEGDVEYTDNNSEGSSPASDSAEAVSYDGNSSEDKTSDAAITFDNGEGVPIAEENNAFTSSEDTYFEELVSEDSEYMAGVTDSINDAIYTALFNDDIMPIAESLIWNAGDTADWVSGITGSSPGSRAVVFSDGTSFTNSDKNLPHSNGTAFNVKTSSAGTIYVYITVDNNDGSGTLSSSAGTVTSGDISARNKTKPADPANVVKITVPDAGTYALTPTATHNLLIYRIMFTSDGGGTDPEPDKGKIGTHTDFSSNVESWSFTDNMPASADVKINTLSDGINGITFTGVSDKSVLSTSNYLTLANGDTLNIPIRKVSDTNTATIKVTTASGSDVIKLTAEGTALSSSGEYSYKVSSEGTLSLAATADVNITSISVTYAAVTEPQPSESNAVDAYVMFSYTKNSSDKDLNASTITDPVSGVNIHETDSYTGYNTAPFNLGSGIKGSSNYSGSSKLYEMKGVGTFKLNSRFAIVKNSNVTITVPPSSEAKDAKLYVWAVREIKSGEKDGSGKLTLLNSDKSYNENHNTDYFSDDSTSTSSHDGSYGPIIFDGLEIGSEYTLNFDSKHRVLGLALVTYKEEKLPVGEGDILRAYVLAGKNKDIPEITDLQDGISENLIDIEMTDNKKSDGATDNKVYRLFDTDGNESGTLGNSILNDYKYTVPGLASIVFKRYSSSIKNWTINISVPKDEGAQSSKLYVIADGKGSSKPVEYNLTDTTANKIYTPTQTIASSNGTYTDIVYDNLTPGNNYTLKETNQTSHMVGLVLVNSRKAITDTSMWQKIAGSGGEGTHVLPDASNNNTENWSFKDDMPDSDTPLTEGDELNGIVFSGSGGSKLTTGNVTLAANDLLKIPVKSGFTGGKLTVVKTAGTITADYNEYPSTGYPFTVKDIKDNIITIKASEEAKITGISIAYDKPEGTNYGEFAAASQTWSFSGNDMPKNAGKAWLSDKSAFDGNMTYSGTGESYFAYSTSGSLHIADGDSLNVPVDITKSGGEIAVTLDGDGTLKSGGTAFIANLTTVRYPFSKKDAVDGFVNVAVSGGNVDITTIAVSYDEYTDGTNYGTYIAAAEGDGRTRTWGFTDDMPTRANAYLEAGNKLDGENITFSGGTDSYFGTDKALHLMNGDELTLDLPSGITEGTITVTPSGSAVKIPVISAGQKSAVIKITGKVSITEIKLTYKSEVKASSLVKAYIYAEKTNGNPDIDLNEGLESDIYSKQNIYASGIFTLKDSSGSAITGKSDSGTLNGTGIVDELGTLTFSKRAGTFKNDTITFTVPKDANANSAKLYVFGGMKNSTGKTKFALKDGTAGTVYANPGGFNGTSFQTVVFTDLKPGNEYTFSCGGSDIYMSLVLVNLTDEQHDTVWEVDPNTPATAESAKIYVYLPQLTGADSKVYSVNPATGITGHDVHIQYGNNTHDTGLNIFSNIAVNGSDSDANTTLSSYSGYVTGYGSVSVAKTFGKSNTPISFTVPDSYSGVESATLYMITSSSASTKSNPEDPRQRDQNRIVTIKGSSNTDVMQAYKLTGSQQHELRSLVFKSLTPGETYNITIANTGENSTVTNMRHGVFVLVLSTENPNDSDWVSTSTEPTDSNVGVKGGQTTYIPFLWDYGENYQPRDEGKWTRNMDWDYNGWRTNSARDAAPYNYGWKRNNGLAPEPNKYYDDEDVSVVPGTGDTEVYWGGDWKVDEVHKITDADQVGPGHWNNKDAAGVNTYEVTIDNFKFDFDSLHFPVSFGGSSAGTVVFSDQGFGTNVAAYSAGYFQVIVPYDTAPSEEVRLRAYIRNFRAEPESGGDMVGSVDDHTTNEDGTGGDDNIKNNEDKDRDFTGDIAGSFLKYNSYMAKEATNINDKDLSITEKDQYHLRRTQFVGESWSTAKSDWDAAASVGDHIDLWGGLQLALPADKFITAADVIQKFDDGVTLDMDELAKLKSETGDKPYPYNLLGDKWWDSIVENANIYSKDADGNPLQPKFDILYGVSKDYPKGFVNTTTDETTSTETKDSYKFRKAGRTDFKWYTYDELSTLGKDVKVTAVLGQMRDAYLVPGIYFSFRVPVVVTGEIGHVYSTTNSIFGWYYNEGETQPMHDVWWKGNGNSTQPTAEEGYVDFDASSSTALKDNNNNYISTKYDSYDTHTTDSKTGIISYSAGTVPDNSKLRQGAKTTVGSSACSRGMCMLVTGYESDVKIEPAIVDGDANTEYDNSMGMPTYNMQAGKYPVYRLYGLETFATDAYSSESDTTKLRIQLNLDEKGDILVDDDVMPYVIGSDGSKIEIPVNASDEASGGSTVSITVNDPDNAGATLTYNAGAYMLNSTTAKGRRQIIIELTNVPVNKKLGDIFVRGKILSSAINGDTIKATATVTGEDDMRAFQEYFGNKATTTVAIAAYGGGTYDKFVKPISNETEYSDVDFYNSAVKSSGLKAGTELGQGLLYTINYSNVNGGADGDIKTLNAYDLLANVVSSDVGYLNIRDIRIFTENPETEERTYPDYTLYFTAADVSTIAQATGFASTSEGWAMFASPYIPGESPYSGVDVDDPIDVTNNEDGQIYNFGGSPPENKTGVYFRIGKDTSGEYAIPAGSILYIQLACKPTANTGKSLENLLLRNTAYFPYTDSEGTYASGTGQPYSASITRSISGIIWQDNSDGIRQYSEKGMSGVQVDLFRKTTEGTYVKLSDGTAQNLKGDVISTITTDDTGTYTFDYLSEGEYAIAFKSGKNNAMLTKYHAVNSRTSNNSDGVKVSAGSDETALIDKDLDALLAKEGYDFAVKYTTENDSITLNSAQDIYDSSGSKYAQDVVNVDLGLMIGGDPLPSTGGFGTEGIKYAGLAIACGAALMLMYDYNKKQRLKK